MIDTLYFQGQADSPWTLDQVFDYKVRYQILVDSDEQLYYLTALQLMYGREIQVNTWEDWTKPVPTMKLDDAGMHVGAAQRKLLSIWFSTSPVTVRSI